MFKLLTGYDFLIVALGTIVLAIGSSMVGCLSVYKGQSLMGDAIGHASYPGIVLAFMCMSGRNPLILTMGAIVTGALAYIMIQQICTYSSIGLDAALAVVLSGFFGLGMVLKSYVQGNPLYMGASQTGLKNYIFGSAAFMMRADVYMIIIFSVLSLSLFFIFKKELIVTIFDREYARSIGICTAVVEWILLMMMLIFIALGLKSVGAILIASFLVFPCICANQQFRKLSSVLKMAAGMAGCSAFFGTWISTAVRGISTGPMIILCMGTLTLLFMIFGRYGIFQGRKERIR